MAQRVIHFCAIFYIQSYMNRRTRIPFFSILLCCLLSMSSCRSIAPAYNYKELARAGIALGIDIDETDNHKLYIEASRWIGTPYRNGGNSRQGTDCSGLTSAIYQKVYKKKLQRSADGQLSKDCKKISKSNLQEGDLVFFHGKRSRKTANHVGIYLKENKFIHTSSSRGVVVDNLNSSYWRNSWLSGGRVK